MKEETREVSASVKKNVDIEFGGPAVYRIVVKGTVSLTWGKRLSGMQITRETRRDCAPRTILIGMIRDQAALNGVLESPYGLHMPIIKVEELKSDC
jgi:hypothetical protein